MMSRVLVLGWVFAVVAQCAWGEVPAIKVLEDVPYKSGDGLTEYEKERCKVDVYLPTTGTNFPVMVWFHGGGLTGGDKTKDNMPEVAGSLAKAGVAVVVANYRLSPKVKFPTYLEDGAAAVKWAKDHLGARGADVNRIFVGGHSAGAYMALMIGLDERHLAGVGLGLKDLAGLVPVSGQTMTHFTVRVERGQDKNRTVADEAAPVHFAGKEGPPMLLLMGDKDWPARLEENAYFVALCRVAGHEAAHLLKVADRDHGSIFKKLSAADDVGGRAVLRFLKAPSEFKLEDEEITKSGAEVDFSR